MTLSLPLVGVGLTFLVFLRLPIPYIFGLGIPALAQWRRGGDS